MTGLLTFLALSIAIFVVINRHHQKCDALRLIGREKYRGRNGEFLSMRPKPDEIEEWRQLEALWRDSKESEKQ